MRKSREIRNKHIIKKGLEITKAEVPTKPKKEVVLRSRKETKWLNKLLH